MECGATNSGRLLLVKRRGEIEKEESAQRIARLRADEAKLERDERRAAENGALLGRRAIRAGETVFGRITNWGAEQLRRQLAFCSGCLLLRDQAQYVQGTLRAELRAVRGTIAEERSVYQKLLRREEAIDPLLRAVRRAQRAALVSVDASEVEEQKAVSAAMELRER